MIKSNPTNSRQGHGGLSIRACVAIGAAAGLAALLPASWLFHRLSGGTAQASSASATSPASPQASVTRTAPLAPPMLFRTDPAQAARARRVADLQRLVEQEAARIHGFASVHVRLATGEEAGVNADYPVDAASVIKVPVMLALYEAWNSGGLKRTPADEHRLRLMITRSKNIVTNELIDELGMDWINACLARHGYTQTRVRSRILGPEPYGPNTVTAAEMTRLFQQIENRELINRRASDEMRRLLLAQHWRERIPAGLPEGVVVGNKTGTLSGVLHDVAFVEAPNGLHYTIAVLVQRQDRAACKSEEIVELSRSVFNHLAATQPVGGSGTASARAGWGGARS